MKNLLLFLLAFNVCHSIVAQSISDYLSAPFPSDLTASPDGKTITWIFNDQGERNIFMATSPGYEATKVTDFVGDTGLGLDGLLYSTDGQTLLFVRGNSKNKSGEAANPGLLQEDTQQKIYVLDIGKREVRPFATGSNPTFSPDGDQIAYLSGGKVYVKAINDTGQEEPKQLFRSRGSVSQINWSPDGKLLAYTSRRGDHSFVGLFDLEKGSVDYKDASMDQDAYPTWSADGKQVAFLRVPNTLNQLPFTSFKEANPWSIRVLDISSMESREIFKADKGNGSVLVRDLPAQQERLWWTSEGTLVFPWEKNGWVQLYALDIESGEATALTPGKGLVEHVQTTHRPDELLLTSNQKDIGKRQIYRLDVNTKKMELITENDNINWSPVRTADGFAYLASSFDRPAWPMIRKSGNEIMLAADLFPKNFPENLVKPQTVELRADDGFETYSQLFLPKNYDPAKKYPAVIFLHGGSRRQMLDGFHYSPYYSNAYALQQYFAASGYIALTLNYRSGIGYGMDFREAEGYGAGGATEVKDVLAAADYLAARKDVDASKIVPWGGSYGGYLTAHALGQAPDKFLAGVDIHGVHDWNKSIPVFSSWYEPEKFKEMADLASLSSPMQHVKNWKDPVLLIHGDDDRNVLFSESVELLEILRKQGVEVESLVFPDEVHSFLLHKNWISAYKATFRFIENQVDKE